MNLALSLLTEYYTVYSITKQLHSLHVKWQKLIILFISCKSWIKYCISSYMAKNVINCGQKPSRDGNNFDTMHDKSSTKR